MPKSKDILTIAAAELGYTESPAGSNNTKYGAWYGLNYQPWCMMFVQWCFAQAGAANLLPAKTASCGALMSAAKSAGLWVTDGYRPGDVAIFDFPGGAATDHCGIIESTSANYVETIEGNTGDGNDANGGAVMRRTRPRSQILGVVRPRYDDEAPGAAFDVASLTDEQVEQLAGRIQTVLRKKPASSYAGDELAQAKALGITDGTYPQAFCTREQAAIMVKRAVKSTK